MTSSQRWIVLRFPLLSLECVSNNQNKTAEVLVYKQRIYTANPLALAQGLTLGMSLHTAQSIHPNTQYCLRDQQREQAVIQQLQQELYCITPHLDIMHFPMQAYGEYALALEVSRCTKLFNGWPTLVRKVLDTVQSFSCQNHHSTAPKEQPVTPSTLHYEVAAAHSQEAAWLLTWSPEHDVFQSEEPFIQTQLQALPIQHLLPFPQILKKLKSMGFENLGDLKKQLGPHPKMSYQALQKRFGKTFCLYLKRVFETPQHTPKPNYQPKSTFRECAEFEYPINTVEWLIPGCKMLLLKLTEHLQKEQSKPQRIIWHLYDINKQHHAFSVQTNQATTSVQLFLELTEIHLQQSALPFSVDFLELECSHYHAAEQLNTDLFDAPKTTPTTESKEKLALKLQIRLGSGQPHKVTSIAEHLPEKSQCSVPTSKTSAPHSKKTMLLRPSWLIDPPIAIQSKDQTPYWHGDLHLTQGPERLTGHWWDTPEERDYFLAVRGDYTRYWIYYERMSCQWYLQGIFA